MDALDVLMLVHQPSQVRPRRIGVCRRHVLAGLAGFVVVPLLFLSPSSVASPASADGGPDTEAGNAPACTVSLSGALDRIVSCIADQPRARAARDAGGAHLAVFDSAGRSFLTVHFTQPPAPGLLPDGSFLSRARVEDLVSDRTWMAVTGGPPNSRLGSIRLTLSSVRQLRGETLEAHGVADAELLPTIEGRAAGTVKMHLVF
ncbi:MAG: hypothetical protein JST00_26500 [Deltaproteobacteria bacterium]|nr:hypothetical protein [Deltaproteobacteria bacterium]